MVGQRASDAEPCQVTRTSPYLCIVHGSSWPHGATVGAKASTAQATPPSAPSAPPTTPTFPAEPAWLYVRAEEWEGRTVVECLHGRPTISIVRENRMRRLLRVVCWECESIAAPASAPPTSTSPSVD